MGFSDVLKLFGGRKRGVVLTDAAGNPTVLSLPNDATQVLRGDGTWGPAPVSGTSGGGGGGTSGTQLISGGQVTWVSGYTYRVSAATYLIGGTQYSSAEQTITLAAPDATFDRIDVIALNTSGTVIAIAGTPSATPSEPSVDPATELFLGFVDVQTGTTQPSTAATETVYAEDAGSVGGEWDWTASAGTIVLNSTNNPYAGSKDIELTNPAAGAYAQGQRGSGSIDPNAEDQFILFIRSKATWTKNRGLQVTLLSNGVLKSAAVQIQRTGTFGFDSSNVSAYQQVAIPSTLFAVTAGTTINQVRIAVFGGAIGAYLDAISWQKGAVTNVTSGITQAQADARYAPLGSAFVTIGTDPTLPNERALAASTGLSLTDGGAGGNATLAMTATGVTAATYGDGTHVAQVTVDAEGRVTAASNVAISAGGAGTVTTTGTPASGNLTQFSGATSITNGDLSGDVTTGGTLATTIAANAVTNAKLAQMAQATIKGRASGAGTGDPTDLSAAQVKTILGLGVGTVDVTIDGGGSVLTTGTVGFVRIPTGITPTITGVYVGAPNEATGSISIDIRKKAFGTVPTGTDSIVASDPPALSSAQFSSDTTLTGWTTTASGGDCWWFVISSVSTITLLQLQLTFTY